MIFLAGSPDYAAQYPNLWKHRPALTLSREAFVRASSEAAADAAEEAETWHGDEAQPKGPNGQELFATPAQWLVMSTDNRRAAWRTWLRGEWLLDWLDVNKPKIAQAVRPQANAPLEQATKQQKAGEKLIPGWAWAVGAAVVGFVIWRAVK